MDSLEFDPIPKIPTKYDATLQIQELDHGMRQLQEKMLQFCPTEKSKTRYDHVHTSNSYNFNSNRVPLNSIGDDLDDTEAYKKEIENLRRQNNKLVLEAAYSKNENLIYEKRLREEALFRESLQDELERLARTVELNENWSYNSKDENFNSVSSDTEKIELLNQQLQIYQQDFLEERKERENLRAHNIEIEGQLEEAKETLERQQKKLLLYSQLFSNPIRSHLHLPTSPPFQPHSSKSSTAPSSPQYSPKEYKSSCAHQLLSKHHKSNDHITEATILSSDKGPVVRRKYSQPATSFSYENFDWDNQKEYISKGYGKRVFQKHCT